MDNYNLFDVFSKTADQLFRDVDLSPAMIYLVDTVNANALPFLASQFDVEGVKGWNLATTEIQKRELLKTAIEIKRHIGTPYAIKRALLATGYDKVTIQEHVIIGDVYSYDGTYIHDGSMFYGGMNWASFNVTIEVPDVSLISDETKALIRQLINYYKNQRSLLVDVIYHDDNLNYYDGYSVHNGTIEY